MTRSTLIFILVAGLLGSALGAVSLPAEAAQGRNPLKELIKPDNGASSFAPAPSVGLKRATDIARERTGGRVLSASEHSRGGVPEFRIRMLVDGERVVTVVVDNRGRVTNR